MTTRTAALLGALALIGAACSSSGSDTTTAADSTSSTDAAATTTATATTEPVDVVIADAPGTDSGTPECPSEGEEWETAKAYIEHNATDEDTGFHGLFGGEGWRELCVTDPNGNQIWLVDPQSQLHDLAVADFFFESREPPNDEYSPDDLRADFPEGEYTVAGTDFEGVARIGSATFTHAIPAEPTITSPPLANDVETAGDATIPASELVVAWDPVTETIDGDPVTISGYEVIVTMEEFEDPNGLTRPVYDVHVPPAVTSLGVPDEFLLPGTIYEVEVLAIEESGNQTIALGFVTTE